MIVVVIALLNGKVDMLEADVGVELGVVLRERVLSAGGV